VLSAGAPAKLGAPLRVCQRNVHHCGVHGALYRIQVGLRWDSAARIRSARDAIPSLVNTLRR